MGRYSYDNDDELKRRHDSIGTTIQERDSIERELRDRGHTYTNGAWDEEEDDDYYEESYSGPSSKIGRIIRYVIVGYLILAVAYAIYMVAP